MPRKYWYEACNNGQSNQSPSEELETLSAITEDTITQESERLSSE